jgi:hypothetical protein
VAFSASLSHFPYMDNDSPNSPDTPVKHESVSEPGLYFWAESVDNAWMVVMEHKDHPCKGTEAHDDWFAHFKDADEVAQQLAAGRKAANL